MIIARTMKKERLKQKKYNKRFDDQLAVLVHKVEIQYKNARQAEKGILPRPDYTVSTMEF